MLGCSTLCETSSTNLFAENCLFIIHGVHNHVLCCFVVDHFCLQFHNLLGPDYLTYVPVC